MQINHYQAFLVGISLFLFYIILSIILASCNITFNCVCSAGKNSSELDEKESSTADIKPDIQLPLQVP